MEKYSNVIAIVMREELLDKFPVKNGRKQHMTCHLDHVNQYDMSRIDPGLIWHLITDPWFQHCLQCVAMVISRPSRVQMVLSVVTGPGDLTA